MTGRQQISTGGGQRPVWSRNGRELFFSPDGREMFMVAVQSGPTLIAGRPQKLFDAAAVIASGGRAYDIAPDGRFLIVRSAAPENGDASPNLVLVQYWFEALKRLEPVP